MTTNALRLVNVTCLDRSICTHIILNNSMDQLVGRLTILVTWNALFPRMLAEECAGLYSNAICLLLEYATVSQGLKRKDVLIK